MVNFNLLQFQRENGETFSIWENEANKKAIADLRKDKKIKELQPLIEKGGE